MSVADFLIFFSALHINRYFHVYFNRLMLLQRVFVNGRVCAGGHLFLHLEFMKHTNI